LNFLNHRVTDEKESSLSPYFIKYVFRLSTKNTAVFWYRTVFDQWQETFFSKPFYL
jgi:hypothetical protein